MVSISRHLRKFPHAFDLTQKMLRRVRLKTAFYEYIEEHLSSTNVTFMQIGSNDGISTDPLREFIVAKKNWRGLFIEPVPQLCDRIKNNYRYLNRGSSLMFLNAAISDSAGSKILWKIQDRFLGTFPPFASQLASFEKAHIVKHFPEMPGVESKLEQISVQSMTYEMARLHADIRHVDLLHIDAEGHESFILRSIDFSLDRPDFILFEISHMDQDARALNYRLLVEHGYSITELGQDCAAHLISKPCQMTTT